jgi:hypothetical protein
MTPAPVIILLPFDAGSPEPLRKAKPRYPTKRGVERWPPQHHQAIPKYKPPADLIASPAKPRAHRHDARSTPRELNMDSADAEYVLRVIASRCGDALDAVTLAEIEAALKDKPAPIMLPAEIAARIGAVLDAIEERLAAMEEALLARKAEDERRAIEDERRVIENAFIDSAGETLN